MRVTTNVTTTSTTKTAFRDRGTVSRNKKSAKGRRPFEGDFSDHRYKVTMEYKSKEERPREYLALLNRKEPNPATYQFQLKVKKPVFVGDPHREEGRPYMDRKDNASYLTVLKSTREDLDGNRSGLHNDMSNMRGVLSDRVDNYSPH